jgi:hypothetical protein
MEIFEYCVVGLTVLAALWAIYRRFNRLFRRESCGDEDCGCAPKLKAKEEQPKEQGVRKPELKTFGSGSLS